MISRFCGVQVSQDRICMAPSGVQKERMQPEDIYVLNGDGETVQVPATKPPPYKPPKLSECHPLFMIPYRHRGAGAVIHSHSIHAVMATMLDPNATGFALIGMNTHSSIPHAHFHTLSPPPFPFSFPVTIAVFAWLFYRISNHTARNDQGYQGIRLLRYSGSTYNREHRSRVRINGIA